MFDRSREEIIMPIVIDLDQAIFDWQARHGERITYAELAKRAGISIAALYRIKSGSMVRPDLRKINKICKVLECEPWELLMRIETGGKTLQETKYDLAMRARLLKKIEEADLEWDRLDSSGKRQPSQPGSEARTGIQTA